MEQFLVKFLIFQLLVWDNKDPFNTSPICVDVVIALALKMLF